jgi:Ni,Fe-hydrogenase III large subunit
MSPSFAQLSAKVASLPVQESAEWARAVRARLTEGARPVTLFGRPDGAQVVVTAVLQNGSGALEALRGRVDPQPGYHTLTRDFPAVHCFERELHEQYGVRVSDHPWLKPIRFEGVHAGKMNDYPFYRLEGKEVHEVAVGPVHAGVIEPGSFRFMCLGEKVHHLEIHLGYQHRGAEALLKQGDLRAKATLCETLSGDSSIAHAWAYCAAVEALCGGEVSREVEVARAVALELERVAMHLAGLSGLATDIGFLQGAATYGRLRTTAINTSMKLCGSRFGRGWLRPGGQRGAMGPDIAKAVRGALELLTADLPIINDCFCASLTVQHRFRGVGVVTAAAAKDIGLVGMAARASGVAVDQRAFRLGAYADPLLSVTVEETGDCWARAHLRIHELQQSLEWLTKVVPSLAGLAPSGKALLLPAPEQLVVTVCEGWRGEVVHAVETGAAGQTLHYKVQDPSLRNWFGLAMAVRENDISDFPICNKSFDLSYCGNDL